MSLPKKTLLTILMVPIAFGAYASSGGAHADPVAPVILGVTGILFFAVLGRFVARNLGQPSVLGELLMGVLLGTIGYLFSVDFLLVLREGPTIFDIARVQLTGGSMELAAVEALGEENAAIILNIMHGPQGAELTQVAHTVDVFSRYGVIFLLFLVGLETSVKEMREVGGESSRVALLGVVLPFVFGFMMARLLMPELSVNVDLFVAATLGATSIGITASVLQDIGVIHTHESRVVMGAAIIDDVLGLFMLAIVSGIIVSGTFELAGALQIVALATVFLITAFMAGPYFLRASIAILNRLDIVEAKMFVSFLFVMALAWFANLVGLATIIGAFAAGVILHDGYFQQWGDVEDHRYTIRDLISPLEVILVPIFFVLMGIQVKLETFLDPHVIVMGLGLIVAAVIGKLLCGLGASRGSSRLAIGMGMVPRGEVGLIFASIGKSLGVFSDELFSALVMMVIVTTLISPPLLKLTFGRIAAEQSSP